MAMDGLPEGVPPYDRVPGKLLLAAPILKRWRRYREENENSTSILGVSSAGTKYRPKGAPRGPQGSQEGARRALGWGRAKDPSGSLVVALPSSFGDSGCFRDADFLYNFSGIFGALLMAGKPEIQSKVTQNMHGASRNYRYVWDVSAGKIR